LKLGRELPNYEVRVRRGKSNWRMETGDLPYIIVRDYRVGVGTWQGDCGENASLSLEQEVRSPCVVSAWPVC